MGTLTRKGLQLILDHWLASSTFPVGLGLFQNDIVPDEHTLIGDLVLCNWTGYIRQSFTNAAALKSDQVDGSYYRIASLAFVANNPGTPNIAYGMYGADNSGAHPLLFAARFETPYEVPSGVHSSLWVNVGVGVSPVEV